VDHEPNKGHYKSAHTNRISRSSNRMNVPELLYNAHISILFHLELITAASGYILKQSQKTVSQSPRSNLYYSIKSWTLTWLMN